MLVFAALTPHPLISIPEIGKHTTAKIRKTRTALKRLREELYAARPDTVMIISPHANATASGFSINQRPSLAADFSKYGDVTRRVNYTNDLGLGYKIKESVETNMPVILTDSEKLDYGSAVALQHLFQSGKAPLCKIIVIGTSAASIHDHFEFGRVINRQINRTNKRVAAIATGDLSHRAGRSSPLRYEPAACEFNDRIVNLIRAKETQAILSLPGREPHDISACILRPLATLLGILGERSYRPEIVCSETVLGVGYLTVHYKMI